MIPDKRVILTLKVFDLQKPCGNKYVDVLRMLVPFLTLFPSASPEKLERQRLYLTDSFLRSQKQK